MMAWSPDELGVKSSYFQPSEEGKQNNILKHQIQFILT